MTPDELRRRLATPSERYTVERYADDLWYVKDNLRELLLVSAVGSEGKQRCVATARALNAEHKAHPAPDTAVENWKHHLPDDYAWVRPTTALLEWRTALEARRKEECKPIVSTKESRR